MTLIFTRQMVQLPNEGKNEVLRRCTIINNLNIAK
jgi:hypothetical protein